MEANIVNINCVFNCCLYMHFEEIITFLLHINQSEKDFITSYKLDDKLPLRYR